MKLIVTAVAIVVGALTIFLPRYGLGLVVAVFLVYLDFGVLSSFTKRLDPLNDVPNAFRVLLASSAALLIVEAQQFLGFSLGVFSFMAALFLNDEYQRRVVDSIRKRRVGGSVALLGIDGSGKSTHAAELEKWFIERGYQCTRVPFHRYLFVERLAAARPSSSRIQRKGRGHPLRPLLSALDNIMLYLISSLGRGYEGRVVLYDRYIWSTYVKYKALGYPVRPVRWLYMLPRPKFAVVLDVQVSKSLEVIQGRPEHIRYTSEVLGSERGEYLRIAEESGFPVVDAERDYASVQRDIERILSRAFPIVGGGH
jgi:dTMP kinase